MLIVVAHGEPAPKGSMNRFFTKTGKVVVTHGNKRTKPWQKVVADAARVHVGASSGNWPSLGPIRLELEFRLTRPKSHRAANGRLRKGISEQHVVKPDLDKLARAALDALKGIAYRDDSQVCGIIATKIYVDHLPGGILPGLTACIYDFNVEGLTK